MSRATTMSPVAPATKSTAVGPPPWVDENPSVNSDEPDSRSATPRLPVAGQSMSPYASR